MGEDCSKLWADPKSLSAAWDSWDQNHLVISESNIFIIHVFYYDHM